MYGWLHVAAIETVVSETDIFVSPTDIFNIINPYQLFGVGALAPRGLPSFIGSLCGDHSPHRTTMTQTKCCSFFAFWVMVAAPSCLDYSSGLVHLPARGC